MGVAVDRGVVSQAVFAHDLPGVTPLSFEAFGMKTYRCLSQSRCSHPSCWSPWRGP
jgi:hypothetical protein